MFQHIRKIWFLMMFMIFFATSFRFDFWWLVAWFIFTLWHLFGINCHPFRILFPNYFAPVPQRVLLEVPFLFWHTFGYFVVPFWHPFGSHLVPIWLRVGCLWLPSASFFLPFAARHWIWMQFRIMFLDVCFATFILMARWRDRGFAAQSMYMYIYIYIYIHIYNYTHIYAHKHI